MLGCIDFEPFWGPFWGPKLASFSICWGSFFEPVFGPFLGHFGGHFGGHLGARSAQEGAKMGSREPSRASKTHKSAFAKTLKNLQFFKVFGVQGCLRQPQKAHEGSQEAPKELQNLKKKSKNGPRIYVLFDQFWGNFGGHFWARSGSKRGPKMGPLLESSPFAFQGSEGRQTRN